MGRTSTFIAGFNFNSATCAGFSTDLEGDGFALTDYSTRGTYVSSVNPFATLVVTAVATTPEPSSVALLLLGVGILFVTRKRMGHSRPSAV